MRRVAATAGPEGVLAASRAASQDVSAFCDAVGASCDAGGRDETRWVRYETPASWDAHS